jgi:uncharacterized membrane protein
MAVKTKVLVGVLVFMIIVNLATLGTYLFITLTRPPEPHFPMGPPPRMMGEGFGGRMPMSLDDDQRRELMSHMMELREEMQPLRDSVMELEREALEMLKQETVSMDEVDGTLAAIAQLKLRMSQAATRRLMEARSFLTPEQQEFFISMIIRTQSRMAGGGPPFDMKPPRGPRFQKPPIEGRRNR